MPDDLGLQYELRAMRSDLSQLRSDLQVNLIEHAKLTQRMETLGAKLEEVEERWDRAVSTIEQETAARGVIFEEALKQRVSLERFSPVERLIYGMVALILVAVVGAIMALVLRGGAK